MSVRSQLVLIFLTVLISNSESLNILVLFPSIGKSHYMVFENLFNELAKKEHNVTIISYFDKLSSIPNIRQINLFEDNSVMNRTRLTFNHFRGDRFDIYSETFLLAMLAKLRCEAFMKSSNVKRFLEEDNSYDVILAEIFQTNCYFGLMQKYGAPTIGLSSTDMLPWMHQWFGNPENPSYIPVTFIDYHDKMTFFERVENTLMLLYSKIVYQFWIAYPGNQYSKEHLGIDLNESGDIMYNISMVLLNRHFTFHTPRPLSPNVIEVGGIHIGKPKELPKNLKKIVDKATNGVIFMSMGSTLMGNTFPDEQRKIFLKEFSKLKQTVIWKWENETMEGLPKNVVLQSWVPQLDILCHPNVKLFITQGGLLSTQEAVNCGVPMILLPQFGDQHYNAAALVRSGVAVSLKLRTITSETLSDAFKKIQSDKISKKAKDLAERFNDRPISPMDTAIYWIEYVAKYKGARFMRTSVTDMPFYQYLLLDVIGFLFVIVGIFVYILFLIYRLARSIISNYILNIINRSDQNISFKKSKPKKLKKK